MDQVRRFRLQRMREVSLHKHSFDGAVPGESPRVALQSGYGVAVLTCLRRKCKDERKSRIITGSRAWKARST